MSIKNQTASRPDPSKAKAASLTALRAMVAEAEANEQAAAESAEPTTTLESAVGKASPADHKGNGGPATLVPNRPMQADATIAGLAKRCTAAIKGAAASEWVFAKALVLWRDANDKQTQTTLGKLLAEAMNRYVIDPETGKNALDANGRPIVDAFDRGTISRWEKAGRGWPKQPITLPECESFHLLYNGRGSPSAGGSVGGSPGAKSGMTQEALLKTATYWGARYSEGESDADTAIEALGDSIRTRLADAAGDGDSGE